MTREPAREPSPEPDRGPGRGPESEPAREPSAEPHRDPSAARVGDDDLAHARGPAGTDDNAPARPPRPVRSSAHAHGARSQAAALLLVAAGALLGWVLPLWERHLPAQGLSFDAATAQATLAAIAGSMITLAGFVVTAITLVVQTVLGMSPRLVGALGHFPRYLVVFGLLVGTAVYALVGLSQVQGEAVPRFSVTFAIGLVLLDTVAVLRMFASLRHAVTAGGLARAVGDRLRATTRDLTGRRERTRPVPGPAEVRHEGPPATVAAFHEKRLVRLARRHDLRIDMACAVGDFVRSGAVIARVRTGCSPPRGLPARTAARIAAGVRLGAGRTIEDDPAYGLRLLADIAIRALSPAINDPTTAVQALDQIEDVLTSLADQPLGTVRVTDGDGVVRLTRPAPRWEDLVAVALDETLDYGSGNVQTVRRLRSLFDRLTASAPADRVPALTVRRRALERLAAAALCDPLLTDVASLADPQGLGGPVR